MLNFCCMNCFLNIYFKGLINLFKGYAPSPRRCVSPGNFAAAVANSDEFLRTRDHESCTEPGQPVRMSLKTILSSHTTYHATDQLKNPPFYLSNIFIFSYHLTVYYMYLL